MIIDTYQSGKVPAASKQPDAQKNSAEIRAQLDAYNRQKDILLYALALLGTVTGYYLGRVPAEQRAQQAQQTANTAQTTATVATNAAAKATVSATQAIEAKQRATRDTTETLRQVVPLIAGFRDSGIPKGTDSVSSGGLDRAQREIELLLERLAEF